MKGNRKYRFNELVKSVSPFYLMALLLCFASCGEIYDIDSEDDEPATMTLDRHEVTLMVGDELTFKTTFTPDDLGDEKLPVYWMSEDDDIATFDDDGVLHAVSEGTCKVYATSVSATLTDECEVTVIEPWTAISNRSFGREMMVYADVKINGEAPSEDVVVGAFCGEELRGVGEMRTAQNKSYMAFRVYSDNLYPDDIPDDFDPYADNSGADDDDDDDNNDDDGPYVEVISFRAYNHKTAQFYEMDKRLAFDGESHGTLSNLLEIKNK